MLFFPILVSFIALTLCVIFLFISCMCPRSFTAWISWGLALFMILLLFFTTFWPLALILLIISIFILFILIYSAFSYDNENYINQTKRIIKNVKHNTKYIKRTDYSPADYCY